jgi:hypothetical protein
VNDIETGVRTMLATRAAMAGDGAGTYAAVQRRIAARRRRRTVAAAALTVLALAGTGLAVVPRLDRDRVSPAGRHRAYLPWEPRGDARGDTALVQGAVRTWDLDAKSRGGGAERGDVGLLWAGALAGEARVQGVVFEANDTSFGTRLVLVTGEPADLAVIADVPAPAPSVHQVSVAVTFRQGLVTVPPLGASAGPSGPPAVLPTQNAGDMSVLAEPGGRIVRVESDRGGWALNEDPPAEGLATYSGSYDQPGSVRVTIAGANGRSYIERPTGIVGESAGTADIVPDIPTLGPNGRGAGGRTTLGWSDRTVPLVAGQPADDEFRNRMINAARLAVHGRSPLDLNHVWRATLPDGTVAGVGVLNATGVAGSYLVLFAEPAPFEGAVYVLKRLTPGTTVFQVSAAIRTRSGTALLVVGAPTVTAIRYLPATGPPVALEVHEGWGVLDLTRPVAAGDRVRVTTPEGTVTEPVTARGPH